MKDELGGKKKTEYVAHRSKIHFYLMNDGSEHKRVKETKKCVIKRILKFNHYKDCSFNNKTTLQSQQRFKNEAHNVYTEKTNKIPLSSNYYKILQTFD